jgi:hypothetical protein
MFIEATPVHRDDVYMTTEEVAARLRISPLTLANQRTAGEGLPHVKVTGRPLYRMADILAAEQDGLRGFTWAALDKALSTAPGIAPANLQAVLDHVRKVLKA